MVLVSLTMHESRSQAWKSIGAALRYRFPLDAESLAFVLASALDFALTWYLIAHYSGSTRMGFIESNPIARYFLYSWGFDGLVWFKVGTVSFVVAICQVIAARRVDVARRVLVFATFVVLAVVAYSVMLLLAHA
jgi:hypothetical protein